MRKADVTRPGTGLIDTVSREMSKSCTPVPASGPDSSMPAALRRPSSVLMSRIRLLPAVGRKPAGWLTSRPGPLLPDETSLVMDDAVTPPWKGGAGAALYRRAVVGGVVVGHRDLRRVPDEDPGRAGLRVVSGAVAVGLVGADRAAQAPPTSMPLPLSEPLPAMPAPP